MDGHRRARTSRRPASAMPATTSSVANLWERPLVLDDEGYRIASTGRPAPAVPLPCLRLEHAREAVAARPGLLRAPGAGRQRAAAAVQGVRGGPVLVRGSLPRPPRTPTRRTPGAAPSPANSAGPTGGSGKAAQSRCPSPFEPSEAAAYERGAAAPGWPIGRGLLQEGAKCVRIVLPEEYDRVKRRFPRLAGSSTTASRAGRAAGAEPAGPVAVSLPAPAPVGAEAVDVDDLLGDAVGLAVVVDGLPACDRWLP